jgi:deoxyribodipyrimidine photolyase-related protein
LRCLDSVVADVWREGWSHHITRLMVLANWATLLGASPRELSDWFWVAYIDAFDWVVEPNVLGMATYATEGLMTTKPYVSGAAYVHKMSDYCEGCQYSPKAKRGDERPPCPMTELYWDFLSRNRPALTGNHRVALPLASEAKRSDAQREAGAARLEELWRQLSAE